MKEEIVIRSVRSIGLEEFLQSHDYIMTEIKNDVILISRSDLSVYLKSDKGILFFEVEIGNISKERTIELYEDLLDLNTEILPVSIGIDKAATNDPRLVLVESRESANLDENELLSVLQTMEIAVAKVELVLKKHLDK